MAMINPGIDILIIFVRVWYFLLEKPEFFASLVALAVAGGIGKYLKPVFGLKPKLKVFKKVSKMAQGKDKISTYWRIAIKNEGRVVAKSVLCEVSSIVYKGKLRKNFIPVPLRWTHLNGKVVRNILPYQTVYLDVLSKAVNEEVKEFALETPVYGESDDLDKVCCDSRINLTIFQENLSPLKASVLLECRSGVPTLVLRG